MASKNKKKGDRTKKQNWFSLKVGSNVVDWRNELDAIIEKQKSNKPEIIYNDFVILMKETFKIPDKDMPPKDEIKKKINIIKAKFRKESICVVWWLIPSLLFIKIWNNMVTIFFFSFFSVIDL